MRKKKRRSRCQRCGELRDIYIVAQNPYDADVNGLTKLKDNPRTRWCQTCYETALGDI